MAEIIAPRRGQFLTENGLPTQRFVEYLEALATQTNDTTTQSDVFSALSNSSYAIAALTKKINDIELQFSFANEAKFSNLETKRKIVTVTSNYTTKGNELVVVNSPSLVTITLNPNANRKESVQIIRFGAGGVNVTATKLINGAVLKTIFRRYTSPNHVFIPDVDSWVVI